MEVLAIIDMKSLVRRNISEGATKPLSPSEKFGGESHGLYAVLNEYLVLGDENIWTDAVSDINTIPDEVQDPSTE